MANWCNWQENVIGPVSDLNRYIEERNAALTPVGDDLGENRGRELVYRFADTDQWMIMASPLTIESDQIKARGECKWELPLAEYIALSKQFAAITITLSYSVEGLFDAGVYQIANGKCTLVSHDRGYFHFHPGMDSPIHHRLMFVEADNYEGVMSEMRTEGLIIPGEICYSFQTAVTSRRTGTEIAAFLTSQFPGLEIEVDEMAYTLNEEVYLASLHTELTGQRQTLDILHIPQELRPSFVVAERDITLTSQELDHVIRALIARDKEYGRVERLERLRLHVGPSLFYDTYKNDIISRITNAAAINHQKSANVRDDIGKLAAWFTSPLPTETSIKMGYGNYFPTKEELEMVLNCTTDPLRRGELWDAILSPKWTTTWPEWDRRQLAEAKEQSRDETGSEEGDFLDQLKAKG